MNLLLFLVALLSFTGIPVPKPTRILAGVPPEPVVSGAIWLIANRWGAYPGVLVATIQDGALHARTGIQFPPYWEQAFDYKVLVAVSNHPTAPAPSANEDSAYEVGPQPPAYLNGFSDIYVSPPLAAQQLGKNWQQALQEVGRTSGDALVLPPPLRRTIRFEYPDGKPLARAQVYIALYGSNQNHCDVPVGIELGGFKADSKGEISFTATNSAIAIHKGHFEQESGGPAGIMYTFHPDVIVNCDQHIILKRLWDLPQREYVLRLRTPDNHAVAHARLNGCDNFDGCGTGCGPLVGSPESDGQGVMRFRQQDLREKWSLTLVNAAGQERRLTDSEMNKLLTTHQLHLVW
jgi:hypothetical protein